MKQEQQIFKLHSEYQPTGDQPQAIAELVKGFQEGNQFETLLGVTGSGKTFTVANVIAALNKPTLVIAHNSTAVSSARVSLSASGIASSLAITGFRISSPESTVI